MSGLVATDLERYYGHWKVVDKVTVDVQRGQVVGLLGPNGAGKTTTFYLIVGLLRVDGGRDRAATDVHGDVLPHGEPPEDASPFGDEA